MEKAKFLLEPIDHESVADAVVEQFETLIVSGVLKEGQKLPPEREMAEILEVSRPKLREALKRLEDQELIVVKHGEGSFIAPLIGKAMSAALVDLYARHHTAFYDYLEYRREQEGFAAALAAQRATASDKEILGSLMARLEKANRDDDKEASKKADIEFHLAIVDASHNSTLIHMMASIYDLTKRGVFYNRDNLRTIDHTGEKLLSQHLAIGNAICEGRADDAKAAAQAHIDFVETTFRASEQQLVRDKIADKRRRLVQLNGVETEKANGRQAGK